MTKSTITKTWLGGVIAIAAGLLLALVGVGLMLAFAGHFVPAATGSGYDFTPTLNAFFWGTIALMVVGGLIAVAGAIAQLVAWIGAVLNTSALEDRTWFVIVLVGGLVGLVVHLAGFAVMLAYVLGGPDETALRRPAAPAAPPLGTPLPTA